MEVRLDPRLLALSAALTAGGVPAAGQDEHPLVTDTRRRLAGHAADPGVRSLCEAFAQHRLPGLAAHTVQLGPPPEFDHSCPDGVPPFVEAWFAGADRTALAEALRSVWRDLRIGALLQEQAPRWEEVVRDLSSRLADAQIEPFQRLFWGRFPYEAVLVPVWNMNGAGLRGVGVATFRESFVVCPAPGDPPLREADLLVLAQHEASHPVLDHIQRQHPQVAGECAFVERDCPPAGRFAQHYEDPAYRWVETLIRTSGCFYLEYLGLAEEAEAFAASQVEEGVTAIPVFREALRPWWEARRQGTAPGLELVLPQLPAWLRSALARQRQDGVPPDGPAGT
mgnify:CR=1 FL=1